MKRSNRTPSRQSKPRRKAPRPNNRQSIYEVNFHKGLKRFVQRELRRTIGKDHRLLPTGEDEGIITFESAASPLEIVKLKTAHEAYRVLQIEGDKPRAIMEPLVAERVTEALKKICALPTLKGVKSFRFSAAGSDSSEMKRIRAWLSQTLGLPEDENGMLKIRLRRSIAGKEGWELLVRLSPQPLSHRTWRTSHLKGALDPTIARVMAEMVDCKPEESVLDLMCGSGTISSELLGYRPPRGLTLIDIDEEHLSLAKKHVSAVLKEWRLKTKCSFENGSIFDLQPRSSAYDVIVSNPPWGEGLGAQQDISRLYSALLRFTSESLTLTGRVAIIVQNADALRSALSEYSELTIISEERALQVKGYHPTIFLIARRSKLSAH